MHDRRLTASWDRQSHGSGERFHAQVLRSMLRSRRRRSARGGYHTAIGRRPPRRPDRRIGSRTLRDPGSSATLSSERATRRMTNVPAGLPSGSLDRTSSIDPAGPSAHAIPPLRALALTSSTSRLRLSELLLAEHDREPTRPPLSRDQVVGSAAALAQVAVRDWMKQAGGTWSPQQKLRRLSHGRVRDLGLSRCIVDAPASSSRYPFPSAEHSNADTRTASR